MTSARRRLAIGGTVQGVGFRPFVYRLAQRHGLAGFVFNSGGGVIIEAEGPLDALAAFETALRREAPPLAVIARFSAGAMDPRGDETAFAVRHSETATDGALVPPDVGPCPACIAEVLDAHDRRHLYPFTTCTDCGPRLTIVEALPYDRLRTTMRDFPLCPACAAEYEDPASRRFHAEAIACPDCGPHLSHTMAAMADVIASGGIVAVKGLGGFHLACNAASEDAVSRLRRRKGRDAKPFAVMVPTLDAARRYADLTVDEAALLEVRERPIVIVNAAGMALAPGVSSGLPSLGLMLPSSMLHFLLLRETAARGFAALVMTSGNLSGEPVLIADEDARTRLADVADLIVTHNRRIAARADDSVMRGGAFVRRSRGSVPVPIALKEDGPDVLALGGDLKVTACVLKGREAHLSAHVGDLETPSAIEALEQAALRLVALTGARPCAIVHDLHPDFASTLLAKRLAAEWGCPALAVQHHHAHAAAVAAEHQLGDVIAVTLDGFGLGAADNAVRAWGGEVLRARGAAFERIGTQAPLIEPGGDAAARAPWRMAVPVLVRLGIDVGARFPGIPQAAPLAKALAADGWAGRTSSTGRLFDAAAALLGVCTVNRFEAEAAMRLEALARTPRVLDGGFILRGGAVDFAPLLDHFARDAADGADLLHGTVAEGFAALVAAVAPSKLPVVLGGGCFLNRVLTAALHDRLTARGFCVFTAKAAPCNDGGLALGQAVIGRAMMLEGRDVSGGSR